MYDDILQHIHNPQTLIIDLRDEFSFRQHHLKNAINIPKDDLKSQIPYLPHDKLLYFICVKFLIYLMINFYILSVILEKLLKRWQNNANN